MENIRILKKNPNKVKVKTETDKYSKNFNFKLIWKDEIDMKIDNILNNYNPVEILMVETEEFK